MKKIVLTLAFIILIGCSKNPEVSINHISGYWEIEHVILANGKKHQYTFNETIDYFHINDSLTGFRKKLKPNFSGTYSTSNDAEQLKLVVENDSLNVYYNTSFSEWKETILLATESQLKVINQNKDVYLYKRYIPINLN